MAIAYRRCKHCEELYPTKTSRSTFCSSRCKMAYTRATPQTETPYEIKYPRNSQIRKQQEQDKMKEQDSRILRLELLGMDVTIQIRQLPANPLQPQMTEQEIEGRVESVIAYLLPDSSQHV